MEPLLESLPPRDVLPTPPLHLERKQITPPPIILPPPEIPPQLTEKKRRGRPRKSD